MTLVTSCGQDSRQRSSFKGSNDLAEVTLRTVAPGGAVAQVPRELATGRVVALRNEPAEHAFAPSSIRAAAISPRGDRLALGTFSGTITIHAVPGQHSSFCWTTCAGEGTMGGAPPGVATGRTMRKSLWWVGFALLSAASVRGEAMKLDPAAPALGRVQTFGRPLLGDREVRVYTIVPQPGTDRFLAVEGPARWSDEMRERVSLWSEAQAAPLDLHPTGIGSHDRTPVRASDGAFWTMRKESLSAAPVYASYRIVDNRLKPGAEVRLKSKELHPGWFGVSPAGEFLQLASGLHLFDVSGNEKASVPFWATGWAATVTASADGSCLASVAIPLSPEEKADFDKGYARSERGASVDLWSAQDLKHRGTVPGQTDASALALDPHGRRVTAYRKGQLTIFDTDRLAPVEQIDLPGGATQAQFSGDGKLLAFAPHRGAVWIVDLAGRRALGRIDPGSEEIITYSFNGQSDAVLVGFADGALAAYKLR